MIKLLYTLKANWQNTIQIQQYLQEGVPKSWTLGFSC